MQGNIFQKKCGNGQFTHLNQSGKELRFEPIFCLLSHARSTMPYCLFPEAIVGYIPLLGQPYFNFYFLTFQDNLLKNRQMKYIYNHPQADIEGKKQNQAAEDLEPSLITIINILMTSAKSIIFQSLGFFDWASCLHFLLLEILF